MTVHAAIHRFLREAGSPDQDQELSTLLAQAVAEMVDPEPWGRARKQAERAGIPQYNLANCNRQALDEAGATNPGTLNWVTRFMEIPEHIHHPGQVIAMARQSMTECGMDPRWWKKAAAMGPEELRELNSRKDPGVAAAIINIAGEAGRMPQVGEIERFTQGIGAKETMKSEPGRSNLLQAAMLAVREYSPDSPDQDDSVRRRSIEVVDYVAALSQEGERLRAKTWRGLVRAAERWHRQQRQRDRMEQFEKMVRDRPEGPHRWRSLLGRKTLENGTTIVPLTREEDLRDESIEMEHCVINYGPDCARGRSRIFSLRREGSILATGGDTPRTPGVEGLPGKDLHERLRRTGGPGHHATGRPGVHPGGTTHGAEGSGRSAGTRPRLNRNTQRGNTGGRNMPTRPFCNQHGAGRTCIITSPGEHLSAEPVERREHGNGPRRREMGGGEHIPPGPSGRRPNGPSGNWTGNSGEGQDGRPGLAPRGPGHQGTGDAAREISDARDRDKAMNANRNARYGLTPDAEEGRPALDAFKRSTRAGKGHTDTPGMMADRAAGAGLDLLWAAHLARQELDLEAEYATLLQKILEG